MLRVAFPLSLSAGSVLFMALVGQLLQNKALPLFLVSQHEVVNFTFTMQAMVLPVSFLVLIVMFVWDRQAFREFFRAGTNSATASASQWKQLGPLLAIAFTLGTTMYMSFSVFSQGGEVNASFFRLFPLVLLFAATNAWSEEIFSRFVLVSGLHGKFNPVTICWISAIFFGVPHFFGTPSGVFGVIMSGLMGWVLAKSVIETKGLGWALFIHFLQDVVIFGAGAMVLAGQLG
jgi:membrane protease YdiL (CAAX protease family)